MASNPAIYFANDDRQDPYMPQGSPVTQSSPAAPPTAQGPPAVSSAAQGPPAAQDPLAAGQNELFANMPELTDYGWLPALNLQPPPDQPLQLDNYAARLILTQLHRLRKNAGRIEEDNRKCQLAIAEIEEIIQTALGWSVVNLPTAGRNARHENPNEPAPPTQFTKPANGISCEGNPARLGSRFSTFNPQPRNLMQPGSKPSTLNPQHLHEIFEDDEEQLYDFSFQSQSRKRSNLDAENDEGFSIGTSASQPPSKRRRTSSTDSWPDHRARQENQLPKQNSLMPPPKTRPRHHEESSSSRNRTSDASQPGIKPRGESSTGPRLAPNTSSSSLRGSSAAAAAPTAQQQTSRSTSQVPTSNNQPRAGPIARAATPRNASSTSNINPVRHHSSRRPAVTTQASQPTSGAVPSTRLNGPVDGIAGMRTGSGRDRLLASQRDTLPLGNIDGHGYSCIAKCGYADEAGDMTSCDSAYHKRLPKLTLPAGNKTEQCWYHNVCVGLPANFLLEPGDSWFCPDCVRNGRVPSSDNDLDGEDDDQGRDSADDSEDKYEPDTDSSDDTEDDRVAGNVAPDHDTDDGKDGGNDAEADGHGDGDDSGDDDGDGEDDANNVGHHIGRHRKTELQKTSDGTRKAAAPTSEDEDDEDSDAGDIDFEYEPGYLLHQGNNNNNRESKIKGKNDTSKNQKSGSKKSKTADSKNKVGDFIDPELLETNLEQGYYLYAGKGDDPSRQVPMITYHGDAWLEEEKEEVMRLMQKIMSEGNFQGENRFREVARCVKRLGYSRDWVAVKNAWNRGLRERSGLDERRRKTAALTTSKQDAETKRQNREKREGGTGIRTPPTSSRRPGGPKGRIPKGERESDDDNDDDDDDNDAEVVPPKRRRAAPHAIDHFPGLP